MNKLATTVQTKNLKHKLSVIFGQCLMFAIIGAGFLFTIPKGTAQDLAQNLDLEDSELSLSLSTTINFGGALGGSITVGQYGLFNTTNIIQAGSKTNTIEIIQQGNNNQADIAQSGIDNKVFLLQNGINNLFTILQNGNGNTANVEQLGEQTFNITQIGNEMVVNVTQYKN